MGILIITGYKSTILSVSADCQDSNAPVKSFEARKKVLLQIQILLHVR